MLTSLKGKTHTHLSAMADRCSVLVCVFSEGVSEVQLTEIEAQIGCRLPDDYRCSYRIHNGQKLVIPGSVPAPQTQNTQAAILSYRLLSLLSASPLRLMGSMSLSNHYRSEVLLDVETAAGGFHLKKGMRRCLPLTFCFHTGLSQYMALETTEGRRLGESFYPCPVCYLPVFLSFQNKMYSYKLSCFSFFLSGSDGSGPVGYRHVHHRCVLHITLYNATCVCVATDSVCVCVFRLLLLRVVHHIHPQRGHRRISHHQRPDLQVVSQPVGVLSARHTLSHSLLLLTLLAGMFTISPAWPPPGTSPSPSLPPSCRSCRLSIRHTSSSHTASGT